MANLLMIQSTASNDGKSILTTALCRILYQDGYTVAPFKAWNMALNSYVTPEGGEVGRAQVVQAIACGVEVQVEMQPFLIKPKGDGTCQIMVRGRPLGDVAPGQEREGYIPWARGIISSSMEDLLKDYEVLVIEGAGSPAEINLRDRDLANMVVALMKKTPVLLVADLSQDGVLSSMIGTLELLPQEERELVKGFILNKGERDLSSYSKGIDILQEKTKRPVLGVIPYIEDMFIPDEDSMSLKNKRRERGLIRIGVLRLPYISNFTDFQALEEEAGVEVFYLEGGHDLKEWDALILPGTKNTTHDLFYLYKSGLAQAIKERAREGCMIIGICGGYQMLGERLLDPHQTEGRIKEIEGLGLLDLETTFTEEKITHRVTAEPKSKKGLFKELETPLTGYEIHMGRTCLGPLAEPLFLLTSRSKKRIDREDGAIHKGGTIWGTYIHGLMDNQNLRHTLINYLARRKGLSPFIKESFVEDSLEERIDRLAMVVREHLDLQLFYRILRGK